MTSRHIAAYVDAVAARTSQTTASNHYRALQQFFKYLALEEALRDTAIIMVLIDTGVRPGESASLNHAVDPLGSDVEFDYNVLHTTDAHERRRAVPFSFGTRRALELEDSCGYRPAFGQGGRSVGGFPCFAGR